MTCAISVPISLRCHHRRHPVRYEGNKAVARLAGQREDYLYKALSDFKSGARVGSGVASMADVVYSLQDDDLRLLAHYMAVQP
jgi:cytochrome c553